jgi:hypothetical protein
MQKTIFELFDEQEKYIKNISGSKLRRNIWRIENKKKAREILKKELADSNIKKNFKLER